MRKRPGMYIGSTDTRGLMHCLWEIIDNGVDEALAGAAHRVEVVLHPDGSAEVHDDGRGIPTDKEPKTGLPGVEVVATKLHAGGKFGGGSYVATGGLHGVGLSVVNALSSRMDIDVERSPAVAGPVLPARRARRLRLRGPRRLASRPRSGLTRKGGRVAKGRSGTRIRFWPDRQIFTKDAHLRLRRAGHPCAPDLLHRPRPRARAARPARRRAGRGELPPRRRHQRVHRVPGPRRGGHLGAAPAGQRHVHRDRPAARRQGPHDARRRSSASSSSTSPCAGAPATTPSCAPSST